MAQIYAAVLGSADDAAIADMRAKLETKWRELAIIYLTDIIARELYGDAEHMESVMTGHVPLSDDLITRVVWSSARNP